MELRSEGIRMWMFNRCDIPSDIINFSPDPSKWGTALADFPNLERDIESHFKNLSIIANIDLCGDWAGQQHVFGANEMCTGNCYDWVALNASNFEEAYWEFGGFWVYQAVWYVYSGLFSLRRNTLERDEKLGADIEVGIHEIILQVD
jgi:hypothetical protein